MHHSFSRQTAAAILLVFALLVSACSGDAADVEVTDDVSTSSPSNEGAADPTPAPAQETEQTDEGSTAATDEGTVDEADEAEGSADEGSADEPAGTSDESATDAGDDAAAAENLTPSDELLYQLNQVSFGIEPTQAEIDCMQVYFTYELAAGRTFFSVADPTQELDDQGLRDLAYASNGCVNNQSLYGWAIGATGVTGDVLANGPDCLTTWFGDETWGDTVFHSFTALTFQYRIDPDAQADVINSLIDCAPVSSLNDFIAAQAETASGFNLEVDRECLFTAIDNPDASLVFWETLVDGTGAPVDVMAPYVAGCSAAFEAPSYINVPDDFAPFSGARQLSSVEPDQRNGLYSSAPALTIDPNGRYEAVIATGGGEVRITLLADIAPNTVNNFVNLANDGYYDGLGFHRVITDFMAQGGDPSGVGTGGPGYSFGDEFENNPPLDRKGILAMANSGPDTNGSQFFITTAPTEWLNGLHTVFGVVVSGQEFIDGIDPRDPQSPGSRAQLIDSVTIVES